MHRSGLVFAVGSVGYLLDALDPTTQGYFNSPRLPLPKEGQPGTFRGLLEWKRRDEEIIAPTVYHDGALMRQMSVREKGNALDIPVDRAEEMTESNLELLTQTVTPGKIYYAGIYFLASYDDLKKSLQGPRNRDGRSDQEDGESHSHHTKRRKIETDKAEKNSTENIDACLVHEVGDGEVEEELFGVPSDVEHDEHVNENHINEEGEPNAKAAKSDDSKVPIHLWNDRVVEQLKEQWAENKRKIAGKLTEEYDSTGKGSLQHFDLSEGSSDIIRFDRWLDLMRAASINCWKRRVKRDFEK